MQEQLTISTNPAIKYAQKSVLIVEDFAEFARALKSMMMTMGANHIDLVYNGEDAIQACKEKKYDIILSDYNLGDSKDGQQILEELHYYKLMKSNTTFIMVTAENTTAMVMGALEYQPDCYLTKPFNGNILKARLDRAVYKKDLLAPIARLVAKKEWQNAVEACDEIANKQPKYRMACLRLKFACYKSLKHYDKALELTTDIMNERPIPWAMLGVGEIFYAKGNKERAAELFKDMILEFPMVLEGYDWLAKIQHQMGQAREAQDTVARAVERSPKALRRQKLLGQLAEENKDIETMSAAFRQAVKYGANSAFATPDEFIKLTRAIGLQLKGNPDDDRQRLIEEVESIFAKLSIRFKGNSNTQFRSAVANADFNHITNNSKRVAKLLETVARLFDRLEENFTANESIEIAESLRFLGQDELAESVIEEAVEQYFDNPKFIEKAAKLTRNKDLIKNSQKVNQFNNKAIQYFQKNELSSAISYFVKASEIAPNNVNINLNLVQSLLKRAQQEAHKNSDLIEAEKILRTITRLGPGDDRYPRYSELSRLTQLMIQNL